jgi:hypothetical protein
MTTHAFARDLDASYERYRVHGLDGSRHAPPDLIQSIIDVLLLESHGLLTERVLGRSFEGRPIRCVSLGTGPVSVLLWSQMHGDEPTATAAILDVINYLLHAARNGEAMFANLSLTFLPMLNPDGAARVTRRTAQAIDMNRDALALVTPEARILKELRDELRPAFGFNLHDQELSTVGASKELTAVALLAPAFDAAKSENDVRLRARQLSATLAEVLNLLVPGNVARYDDAFEARAFGDNMQRWGTSTVLVESGHAMNDPEKRSIRRLNFTGLLAAFAALAGGEYAKADLQSYERLPFNGKKAYDLIVRHVTIDGAAPFAADLGISRQVDTHAEDPPRLVDIGDLSTYVGLQEIDAQHAVVSAARLKLGSPCDWPVV